MTEAVLQVFSHSRKHAQKYSFFCVYQFLQRNIITSITKIISERNFHVVTQSSVLKPNNDKWCKLLKCLKVSFFIGFSDGAETFFGVISTSLAQNQNLNREPLNILLENRTSLQDANAPMNVAFLHINAQSRGSYTTHYISFCLFARKKVNNTCNASKNWLKYFNTEIQC